MTELDFDVHFGPVNDKKINWRDVLTTDEPDDDEELDVTPEDVVGMLGFDPKEFDEEVVVKEGTANSGNRGHSGRPGHVGGSGGGSFGRGVLNLTPEQMALSKTAVEQMDKDIFNREVDWSEESKNAIGLSPYGMQIPAANKLLVQEQLSESLKNERGFSYAETAYRKELASSYVAMRIDQWANSSGDTDPQSIGMQMVAQEHFKLNEASLEHLGKFDGEMPFFTSEQQTAYKDAKHNIEVDRPIGDYVEGAYKLKDLHSAFLQAQYDATQKYFKDNNIKELILYRGVEHSDAGKLREETIQLQPISSFSTRAGQAFKFASIGSEGSKIGQHPSEEGGSGGTVYVSVVPVEKILSHPRTGFGCTREREVTVLGGKMKATVIPTQIAWDVFRTANQRAKTPQEAFENIAHFNDNFLTALNKVQPAFREKAMKKEQIYNIDSNLNDADWTKQSWDLPEYGSKEFNNFLKESGMTLEKFKKLPVYKWAKQRGEIKD